MTQVLKTSRNIHLFKPTDEEGNRIPHGIPNTQPSMTIPNETLSLQELIDRHVRGQYVPMHDTMYAESLEQLDMPDVSKLSKIELVEYSYEIQEFIKQNRKNINEYKGFKENKEIKKAEGEAAPSTPEAEGAAT